MAWKRSQSVCPFAQSSNCRAQVAAGYAVVGPMLEAYKAGNAPEAFDASWNELRDFRMAIPDDIRELRDEAQRRVSEGEKDIQLVFPEYPVVVLGV